ncbi:MAG: DDE-type integrase/transposase/recombinase [Sandaracinaceae bacterium]|nr:DDE-type integrase/transposase/recombinase [Sandaracinaceae bacterium]
MRGLDAAWTFFGGLVARVLVDNASAMVTSPHPTSPRVNDAFADYAQHRDFFVDTTRVRRPKDKPRVENQMPFVRRAGGTARASLTSTRHVGARRFGAAGWQSASTERPSAWCASTTRQRRSRSCCRLPRSRSTCRFGPKRRCIGSSRSGATRAVLGADALHRQDGARSCGPSSGAHLSRRGVDQTHPGRLQASVRRHQRLPVALPPTPH